jgi:hypothetical protein
VFHPVGGRQSDQETISQVSRLTRCLSTPGN